MSVIRSVLEEGVPSPPAPLSLYLLGSPLLYIDGHPVDIIQHPKVLLLLAYLITAPRPHPREKIAAYFWPDSAAQQAQQNLRQILYRLRQFLNDDGAYVVTDRQTVQFQVTAEVWTDVNAFGEVVKTVRRHSHRRTAVCSPCIARLEEAISLYRGPFLGGVGDIDSQALEEWLLLEREAWQQQAVQTFHNLAIHHFAHRRMTKVQTYVRQLLALDPWNEAALRLSLHVAWSLRGRNVALQEYDQFAADLKAALGVAPEDETRTLRQRIEEQRADSPPSGMLPATVTPFFGREQETRQLEAYLAEEAQRLITLVGVGGSGKTRLALHVAHMQRLDWQDGVWFIPLLEATSAGELIDAIAQALTSFPNDARPPPSRLFDALRHRELLLVLDNFEHLVPEGVPVVADILRRAPQVKILVTSQVRLNILEEWIIALEGLDFPPLDSGSEGPNAAQSDAVQLFLHHAQRVNPAWSPQSEDWVHIRHVCAQVAGLPLGIELAAAWSRTLSCQQIAAASRVDLDFFRRGPGGAVTRHSSLAEVFAHTYAMLTKEEQRLFRQLAVFQGGFDLTAAKAVASASLATLARLLDRSLLQVSAAGRWTWHGLLQRYARSLLADYPAEAHMIRQRHAAYYLDFLRARTGLLGGEAIGQTLAEITAETENVQLAWEWTVSRGDVQELAASLDALSSYYYLKGFFHRGETVFADAAEQLLARRGKTKERETTVIVRLQAERVKFLTKQAKYNQSIAQGQKAISLAKTSDSWHAEASVHLVLGNALHQQGDHAAAYHPLQRALELVRPVVGNDDAEDASSAARRLQAEIQRTLGSVLWKESRYLEAQTHLEQAERISQQIGDLSGAAWVNNNLGLVLENLGYHDQAITRYRQALSLFQKTHDPWGESFALGNLGYVYGRLGMYAKAHAYYQDDLHICRQIGDRRGQSWTLDNLSLLACQEERYADAQQYARQALRLAQDIQDDALLGSIWMRMGCVWHGLGQLTSAADAYRRALTIQGERDNDPLVMEARAGLMRTMLAQDNMPGALAQVETVLTYLQDYEVDRVTDQMGIYLSCYRVLQANDDPRADRLLERAHQLLMAQAERIGGKPARHSFLSEVGSHQALLATWDKREGDN